MSPVLILASRSPYKAGLLERLGVPFSQVAPRVDETPGADETPGDLVRRLAAEKAAAVSRQFPGATVIGADQIAVHAGRILGKPGDAPAARGQLATMSGSEVSFLTAACVRSERGTAAHLDRTRVQFRTLSPEQIRRYVDAERPLDCAGSFKSEGLGIALFERIENSDPTALIGLPLIFVCAALTAAGIELP